MYRILRLEIRNALAIFLCLFSLCRAEAESITLVQDLSFPFTYQPYSAILTENPALLYLKGQDRSGNIVLHVLKLEHDGQTVTSCTQCPQENVSLGYYPQAIEAYDVLYTSTRTVKAYSGVLTGNLQRLPLYQNYITNGPSAGMAIRPQNDYIYALGAFSGRPTLMVVSLYQAETTVDGNLMPKGSIKDFLQSNFIVGDQHAQIGGALAISPEGKYLFIALGSDAMGVSGNLYVYPILENGLVGSLLTSIKTSINNPGKLAIHSSGNFIYLASSFKNPSAASNLLEGFMFEDEELTPITGSPWAQQYNTTSLEFSPQYDALYIAGFSASGRYLDNPGYLWKSQVNKSNGKLVSETDPLALSFGLPSDIKVSKSGQAIVVTGAGPAFKQSGAGVYRVSSPKFGQAQIDVTETEIYVSWAIEGLNSNIVSSAGVSYSEDYTFTASNSMSGNIDQNGILRATLNRTDLSPGKPYYLKPSYTTIGGLTVEGEVVSTIPKSIGLPAQPRQQTSTNIFSSEYQGSHASAQYGFIIAPPANSDLPTQLSASYNDNAITSTEPDALSDFYGSYNIYSYVKLSGDEVSRPPGQNIPTQKGGVVLFSSVQTITNVPDLSMTVRPVPNRTHNDKTASLEFSLSAGGRALGGAQKIGVCYKQQGALQNCTPISAPFEQNWKTIASGLTLDTEYTARPYIQYQSAGEYTGDIVVGKTVSEKYCFLTEKWFYPAHLATLVGINSKKDTAIIKSDSGFVFLNSNQGSVKKVVPLSGHIGARLDERRNRIYYMKLGDPTLYALDGTTGERLFDFPLPNIQPRHVTSTGIFLNKSTGDLFIFTGPDGLALYNYKQNKIVDQMDSKFVSNFIIVDPGSQRIFANRTYFHQSYPKTINVISYEGLTMKLVKVIPQTQKIQMMQLDEQTNTLYVASANKLSAIDINSYKTVAELPMERKPYGLYLNRPVSNIYAPVGWPEYTGEELTPYVIDVSYESNSISLKEIGSLPLEPDQANSIAIDDLSGRVFAYENPTNSLKVIDATTLEIIGSIKTRSPLYTGISYSESSKRLYAVSYAKKSLGAGITSYSCF